MRNKLQTILIGIGLLWGPILANSSTINTINVGSSANDGTGDTLRAAFQKVNSNDAALNADKVENSNGSASGLTLSGTTTIGGTLDVSSATTLTGLDTSDEIAEGLTRGEPSLYFNGGIVQIGTDSGLNLTDGANEDFPQSLSFWVKAEDWTDGTQVLAERHSASRGWQFYISGSGELTYLKSDGTENVSRATSSLSVENGKWYQVFVTDPGIDASTPSSVALDGISIYVNGESQTLDAASSATYEGIGTSNTQLNIGGFAAGSGNFQGEIRNVQLFNSALSAADVETIYRSGVPFELSQASATAANVYDFSTDVNGFSSTTNGTAAGNIDAVSDGATSKDNTLRFTVDGTSGNHAVSDPGTFTIGKRYRVKVVYYIPSGQSNVDQIVLQSGGNPAYFPSGTLDTVGTWTTQWVDGHVTGGSGAFNLAAYDGGSASFQDAGADDVFYIAELEIYEVGAILDLNAANIDPSSASDNLVDASGNGFHGTLNSMDISNIVNLSSALSVNNPSPSADQAIIWAGNSGSEVFSVDEDGDVELTGDVIITNSTTPASASATGTAGTVAWDANYIYICTAANTWKRVAISTW